MSGHNKWSTIKHKKAKLDAQRGKAFSKVAREIVMAAKLGGADPAMNPRLRLALQKAREANMPSDNIKRAVQKGAGGDDDSQLEEITYEAYGPNGVGMIIKTFTDNKNRTVSNIKAILSKGGATMATPGAVSYLFQTKGQFIFEPGLNEELILQTALDNDAENVETSDDGSIEVTTSAAQFETIKTAFDAQKLEYASASVTELSSTSVLLDEEKATKIMALIDKLEDDDDVQDVYTNFTMA